VQIAKAAKGVAGAAPAGGAVAASEPTGPDAAGLKAQNRVLASGGKLSDQEKFKREQHPFDTYERLKEHAAKGEYPKPPDNFRWRFFGLFYVAPNQNSYMCRLRIPNGILNAAQFAGVADLAERYGGGYAHVTTRANLQIREVEAHNSVAMIEAIQDLGLCSRGSGADNIRNVTGTPTAGIDPQELIDTRPLRARMALPHPQRPLALRPAAQIQRRLRRRRRHSGAGGYQRHRLPGRAGE
jgi:ferredoxin-nitrite reductase